jgi:ketosteroid isomerase-like protein
MNQVREGFEAFGRGDFEYILDFLGPDSLWEESQASFPGLDPVYVGREGFRKWMEDLREVWDAIESRPAEVHELPTDEGPSFVVKTELHARGRQEIEVGWTLYNVLWTTGTQIRRRRIYFDEDEAFAEARLTNSEIAAREG